MKITLSRDGMRAALLFAAETDIRYYLCAVLVEATKSTTRVTATNGHICAAHQSAQENELDAEASFSIIIPREVVKLIGKVSKEDSILPLVLEPNGDDGYLIRDMASAIRLGFDPIIAKYPDVAKVIPKRASGEHAQYNPIYVGLMAKAAVALGDKPSNVMFRHNGEGPALALVSGKPEFVAVVMPMRSDADGEETTTRPLWLDEGVIDTRPRKQHRKPAAAEATDPAAPTQPGAEDIFAAESVDGPSQPMSHEEFGKAAQEEIARIEADRPNLESKRTARGRDKTKAALAAKATH